jgi:hypothetical protein
MTDQPTPGKDDSPRGEQPPLDTPPYGTQRAARAAGSSSEPGYGQGQDQAYGPDSRQFGTWQDQPYGHGSPEFGQTPGPYGTAYSQAGEQYSAPVQPGTGYAYGHPGQQYAAPGGSYNAYGQPGYYNAPAQPKALSIASLCCGIAALVGFGFFLLPQIAAVILGHMALSREPAGRGMAIAGLVLGYVGVAVTILVIVIFGLVISSARYTGYGV